MVRHGRIRRFRGDENGTSLVEGLLVLPIVLLTFAALVEFGFAVYQWNQTVKALQLGSRILAVSDPVIDTTGSAWQGLTDYGTSLEGDPVPDTSVVAQCGAGMGAACLSSEIDRLVYGVDASGSVDYSCDPAYGGLSGMCDFSPKIRPANVWVTYRRSGLGYVGRPDGPVVTITVGTAGLGFNLPFLGALLGFNNIEIPAHPVSITSEDLSSIAP
ncbi:TadE family protein [Aliiroseovarius subalbicans]|uniref:TadE/TadG family type IV pilus assembly protein n=1 Tax=Aliiroseovarius subalbicans TaxID=2925840 RepID=UPI001F586BCA|nr:TadE family protein [Aliiroseovarius subalbicans]MCI2400420.1 pilus assembly protein [Aliiroseovarius subalbicans]